MASFVRPGRLGKKPRFGLKPGREPGRVSPPLPYRQNRRRRFRPQRYAGLVALFLVMLAGAGHYLPESARIVPALVALAPPSEPIRSVERHFGRCGAMPRSNCVVDGDTFYFGREKIRIADINTPEASEPGCAAEARLAARATRRLQDLLNAGPVELRRVERDEDVYGRKLRTVHRNGRSLGATLVAEGLAHEWHGYKQDWCG